MNDDEFEPRLGRIRNLGGKKGRNYLNQIVAAAARSGGPTGGRDHRFDGSRIGRGASIGRVLGARDRYGALRGRRAVVKARLVRLAGRGLNGARAHLRYIQRDGVTREGAPGTLYSADRDQADGQAFLERSVGDRHQFRFIVSAEDGAEYPDLKPFTRRLMAQMEADLGTKLDWVAVDHFNTGHPHTHIMLRGVDDRGQNLIIAREYIALGLRERAAELVTLDLGPRTTQEIEARLRHDVDAERLTTIDRRLVRDMDEARIVSAADPDPFRQALRAGRLQKLGHLGLAEEMGAGRWHLADDLEETLRRIGERNDIIRTMQRELTARKLDRPGVEQRLYDPQGGEAPSVIGKVVMRGLSDEHRDRHFLLVDGIDGRIHHVDIGTGDATEPLAEGSIVQIMPRRVAVRDADRAVDTVARANGGRYSIDLHLHHDPSATDAFAETHVRRLEVMRRMTGAVERAADGSWAISEDHLARAAAYEARVARDRPVTIETLSHVPIERLATADAATWIDRTLTGGEGMPVRDVGFGREVREAQVLRRQWLAEQGLAEDQAGTFRFRPGWIATLQRRELLRVAGQLSDELALPFREARPGEPIEGVLRRRVDLASGRFALIEKSREFTLVPWRPTLERHIGKQVFGMMRGDGVNWRFGRERGGPVIS